ncbi:transcriptional regulator [Gordonia pseudamarae]|jgi:DNA-binding HxlR family transcriptional regulator|uniref:Transcriptional regulator n=1 Tax=Gordonia pseudamarae TaxID=2831662 RepID=A0ABX6IGZ2_9ACTN|nr:MULTISPECIES: helix-turn-helix domain-containing protein [Gordonia]MBD0023370.1 helix-turn-helix transcriptional regulator [Gordonia sp. (in: high G+C Gram-positive bacteria)]QHN25593.1 transcriptional regulator [Gordonia pseudamarae]QHN34525.1 transcriptional regulator [Gordonia pseudamarae]
MRSYGQYCGLARSLEIVGDRWNLLIVRELLISPARYRDLAQGLPGIATNMLADRLRDLETAGVVERRLAGEGSVVDYALTPWGAELREPLEGLIRWSTPLMVQGPKAGDVFRPEWLALAVPALLETRATVRSAVTVGLDIGDARFELRATPSGFSVSKRDDLSGDATIRGQAHYILGLAAGALTIDDAKALELIEIDGDESAVRMVFRS